MTYRYDAHAYRQYFEQHFTYLDGFRRNVHRYANRIAMTFPETGETWTYAALGARVDRLATGLTAAGIGPGDVVAYQLFNGPEFALLYLATQACRVVGSPINFRLSAGEVASILDSSTPKLFIYDASLSDTVADATARASHTPAMLASVGTGEPAKVAGARSMRFDELIAEHAAPPSTPGTVWDETTRLYTSGTTGMPKGVPLNSLIEVFSAHDVIMQFPLAPEDKTLNMTPWFHRGGLYSGGPNPVFYIGAQAVPLRHFDADQVLDYTERHQITFLIGAPANLKLLADAQDRRARDLGSLRGIVTMGSPLERAAALRYQKLLTPRIFNGYGTTEGFWNTLLRPVDLPGYAGAAGRACVDDDVAVVKLFDDRLAEASETIARDGVELGEVIIRSPKCANAYANAPELEAQKYHHGWLHAGDVATWDENEVVTIVGRRDDMLISGGENVHPVQVEEILSQHPKVADSLVVGVPHETWGQMAVAYVVPVDGASPTADELDEFCRNHPMLSRFKRPRAYQFVTELPLSATGKKLHYKMAERAPGELQQGLFVRPSAHQA